MFWQEDDAPTDSPVTDDIVDLVFSLDCRQLPVDHAHALSNALLAALPWLADEPRAGIHTVHVAASQNGWQRPEHGGEQVLQLSRRTKLSLRLPLDRVADAQSLHGVTLDIQGFPMTIGKSSVKKLGRQGTVFARHVASERGESETDFLSRMAGQLSDMGIRVKKALCGIPLTLDTPDGQVHTRSLMLSGLRPEEPLTLQQRGLGSHRTMGCGLFIPHKGIDPVKKREDD